MSKLAYTDYAERREVDGGWWILFTEHRGLFIDIVTQPNSNFEFTMPIDMYS